MKKGIMGLILALCCSVSLCFAQPPQDNEGGRKSPIEQIKTELGLTDQQATQLEEIMKTARPHKMESCEKPSKEDMEKNRTEMDAKIKAILTPEQFTKFQSMMQKRMKGHHNHQKSE